MEKQVTLTREQAVAILEGLGCAFDSGALFLEDTKPIAQVLEDAFPGILHDELCGYLLEGWPEPTPEELAEAKERERLRQEAVAAQRQADEAAYAVHAKDFQQWDMEGAHGTDAGGGEAGRSAGR